MYTEKEMSVRVRKLWRKARFTNGICDARDTGYSIGNVVGSNIMNIMLILGITAVICMMKVKESTIRIDMPVLIVASFLMAGWGYFGKTISRTAGVIFLVILAAYLVYLGYYSRKNGADTDVEIWRSKTGSPLRRTGRHYSRQPSYGERCKLCGEGLRPFGQTDRAYGGNVSGAYALGYGGKKEKCGYCHRKHCGQQYLQYPVHPGYYQHYYSAAIYFGNNRFYHRRSVSML